MSKLTHSLLLGASCAFALPALVSAQQINFLDGVALPDSGGEILSYYSSGGTGFIASTYSSGTSGEHGVRLTQLNANGSLSSPAVAQIDLGSTFGATGVFSLSSVQVDNQGRDFGVATLIPGAAGEQRGSVLGKAVFFQLSTGSVLGSVDVGYHPDSVTITPDGNRLVIANEGEFISNAGPQTPGSVSVVQLTGVTSAADLGTKLAASQIGVTSVGFQGLDLATVRINATNPGTVAASDRHLYVEPEYITANNTKAYVSLQENNAVAVIDLASGTVDAVKSLGTLTQRIDASDRDGANGVVGTTNPKPSINITTTATGLLMPDTIAQFERGGEVYLVTANEGDARPDDADVNRSGRLNVVRSGYEGAGNMFGTRSVSIVRASDGQVVWDSSNGQDIPGAEFASFEDYIAANDRTTFGMNQNSAFEFRAAALNNFDGGLYTNAAGTEANSDTRSDDKGPEPESVAFGRINGRDYLFAAMERQGGIFMFDVTDFANVSLVDYLNLMVQGSSLGQPFLSPESLVFVGADQSPTGSALLLVGYENPSQTFGGLAVLDVGAAAIPEPSTFAALAGLGVLGGAALRRRRRA
jgi:hypothetical protein